MTYGYVISWPNAGTADEQKLGDELRLAKCSVADRVEVEAITFSKRCGATVTILACKLNSSRTECHRANGVDATASSEAKLDTGH